MDFDRDDVVQVLHLGDVDLQRLLHDAAQRDVVVHEHLVRVLQQVLQAQRGVVPVDVGWCSCCYWSK